MDMNAHIHFNVYECSLLKGGNGEGQPNKVTAVAIQPRPHFFENPCQHSANPDNQALTKHSSRKSIKPLLSSSPLLLSLASATRAVQALPLAPLCAQRSISPFHQAPPSNGTPQLPGSSRTDSQGHSSSSLSGPSTGSLGQHRCPNWAWGPYPMPGYLTISSAGTEQHRMESRVMAPRMLFWAKVPVLNTALQSAGSQHPSPLCTSSYNLWNTITILFSQPSSASSLRLKLPSQHLQLS